MPFFRFLLKLVCHLQWTTCNVDLCTVYYTIIAYLYIPCLTHNLTAVICVVTIYELSFV